MDGPMTTAMVLFDCRETRFPHFAVIEIECLERGGWNWQLEPKFGPQGWKKEKEACGRNLQLLASWGASDRKATRSRPVKSVEWPESSVDGTF